MNLTRFARRLSERAQGTVQTDYPLSGLTTYRVGGPAAVYFEPEGITDIEPLAELLGDEPDVPVLALGRGSNLVISDEGFEGVVVRLGMSFSWIRPRDEDDAGMTAGSATPLPLLANWAARRSLAGVEFAVAIPGSVGGGVRMNAGAHGGEISDTLTFVSIYDVRAGAISSVDAAELGL